MKSRSNLLLSLQNILGFHLNLHLIVSSLSLSVMLLFYVFSLGSFLKPTVWILIDRVSYYEPFEGYIIDKFADSLVIAVCTTIWLGFSLRFKPAIKYAVTLVYSTLAIISALLGQQPLEILAISSVTLGISLIILDRVRTKKFLIFESFPVVNYLTLIGIAIGIIALLISLESSLNSYYVIPMNNIAHQIFLLFGSLAPALLILLVLAYPVKVIFESIIVKILRIRNKKRTDMSLKEDRIKTSLKVLLLLLFMVIASCMVLIPHQEAINVSNRDVGVDTHFYVEWTRTLLKSNSTAETVREIFINIQHGDRPLSLIFFMGIAKIAPEADLSYFFDNVPIILGPALVIAVYLLTRELTSSELTALLAAFLTSISFHVLVGIYAGSYANWIALIFGYLSMMFMLRFLRNKNKKNIFLFVILNVITLFTHSYTWTILTMFMGLFLLVTLKFNYYNKRNIIILLVVLGSTILFDVVRMTVTGSFSGISYGLSPPFGELKFGPDQFVTRWSSVIDTTQNYYGSLFANSIIYALGLYWLLQSRFKDASTIFLISILSVGIIPLFFGNWIVQSRVFYDIPFQIPAAIGLACIYKKFNSIIPLTPILIWLLAFSITALSNFHFVPPYR